MPVFHTQDRVELNYNDWGQGRPVVLLHGWPLTNESWDDIASALVGEGYRVIAPDRRGFGRSDRPWHGYDYDTLTDDLSQLLEHLNLKNAVLIGYSMGSGEVARYISRFRSERVTGVVIIAGITPQLARSETNPGGMALNDFKGFLDALISDRIGCLDGYVRATFADVAMQNWYSHMAHQASTRAIISSAESWYSTNFREDLQSIDIPTLIIHGSADQSAPVEITGRESARLIKHAQYIEYESDGHYLPFENRNRLVNDLLSFLSSMPAQETQASK